MSPRIESSFREEGESGYIERRCEARKHKKILSIEQACKKVIAGKASNFFDSAEVRFQTLSKFENSNQGYKGVTVSPGTLRNMLVVQNHYVCSDTEYLKFAWFSAYETTIGQFVRSLNTVRVILSTNFRKYDEM